MMDTRFYNPRKTVLKLEMPQILVSQEHVMTSGYTEEISQACGDHVPVSPDILAHRDELLSPVSIP